MSTRGEPASSEPRAARPDDAAAVAELIHESAAAMFERFTGDRDKSLRVLRAAFGRNGNSASREVVWVAESGGVVGAAMAAFPARELEERAGRFLRVLLWRTPPWTWRESLRLQRLGMAVAPLPPIDSLYVDALATAPRQRRRGLASSLLATAEERARRHGLASVALETSADNAPARALYESLGFAAGGERRPQGGLPGFVAYVKRL